MQLILLTKYFSTLSLNDLIETIKSVGCRGADYCVRPGLPVEPENCDKKLPKIVKQFNDEGLTVPMVTAPANFSDPTVAYAEKLFAGCALARVKIIKPGYWFMGEDGYYSTVESVRKIIDKFAKLAEKYNVKVGIHNHSQAVLPHVSMTPNSSTAMNLVNGFDPRYVGIYSDPGHLSMRGESLTMAIDMVKDYLCAVALKDVVWERFIKEDKSRTWQRRFVGLGEGYVDWKLLVGQLKKIKFDGPISIHSEYDGYDIGKLFDQTRMDVRFFKQIMQEQDYNKKSCSNIS